MNHLHIDHNLCIGCGLCEKACPAGLLSIDASSGKSISKPVEKLNWYGCWQCQHCLAVCPQAAISVCDKRPEHSQPIYPQDCGAIMDSLVAGRRSCRHYKQENVDPELIRHMLTLTANAPTGGNKQFVEYSVIDDIETMRKLQDALRKGYAELKTKKIYPFSWDEESLGIMEDREAVAMNGDMFFCSAPHLFVPHMPAKFKSAPVDSTIAMTYFELLCTAHGLGTVYLGFPLNIMRLLPEVYALLGIPEDHFVGNALGFGYPEFNYARGVQKEDRTKIHFITI